MKPKSFSEKWDREEDANVRGGTISNTLRGYNYNWKKYIKYVVIGIIILGVIIVLMRLF